MVDDHDDERARKRRLPPSSEHQLAAENQAKDYLEEMLKNADRTLQEERQRIAALTPSQAQHPNYPELRRTHERADVQTIMEHERRDLQVPDRTRNLIEEQAAREKSVENQRGRQESPAPETKLEPLRKEPMRERARDRSNTSTISPDGRGERDRAEEHARRQDEQGKSADRQNILREHSTEAPAEKAAEIKAEKLHATQRRALWGDEFRTTFEERMAVEKSQNIQQSKGLGRSR